MSVQEIKVWDLFVRLFHWSLVVAFSIAYLTEDDVLDLHVIAGYAVLGLLLLRLIWGVIGPRYARFSDFVYRPTVVKAFIKDTLQLKARRYLGHNPAGGAFIVLMLLTLLLTSFTGLVIYGIEEGKGPLAMLAGSSRLLEDIAEEAHEFFANFMLLLVGIHLFGVIAESLIHKENLIKAMFTGKKPLDTP